MRPIPASGDLRAGEPPSGFAWSFTDSPSGGPSRTGLVSTPHGDFETPAFFPVGTRGAVKTLDGCDLKALGIPGVLANAYHLMLRPGAQTVADLGGIHSFMAFDGPILTDSGGFQAMSLDGRAQGDGIEFRSIYDGSPHLLTPEQAVEVQELLGPDFAVALDFCPALPAPREVVARAVEVSLAWSERCQEVRGRSDQFMFGVVQGGVDPALRRRSADAMVGLAFDGYSIGGLAVGEPQREMLEMLEVVDPILPRERLRYLMGVGDPVGIVEASARGVDLFDCVLPTRLARHGTALTSRGRVSVKAGRYSDATSSLDESCPCQACTRYSIGALRHLSSVGEVTAKRLLTIHNITFMLKLMEDVRNAIRGGTIDELIAAMRTRWSTTDRDPVVDLAP